MAKQIRVEQMVGQKFGRLTVLRRTSPAPKTALCRCDCGNEVAANPTSLRLGKEVSCGCDSRSAKHNTPVDPASLVGQRFARLIVIGVAPAPKTARCQCDCGNTVDYKPSELLSGRRKSCGCLWKENVHAKNPGVDARVGQRFGKLTITGRAPRLNGRTRYETVCDCGTALTVDWINLSTGNTKSCGCLRSDNSGEHHYRWLSLETVKGRLALLAPQFTFPNIDVEWQGSEGSVITVVCKDHGTFTHNTHSSASSLFNGKLCVGCGIEARLVWGDFGTSKPEKEVFAFLESLGVVVTRGLLPGTNSFHFDCIVESLKLVVEFNGVYWHSYPRAKRGQHYHKRMHAEKLGYRMITVWEDDWTFKRARMESLLRRTALGATEIIGARKLTVGSVDRDTAADFHRLHHVQGFETTAPTAHYTLSRAAGETCAVASFDRKGILHRYTVVEGLSIPGGLQKLIAAFRRKHGALPITTFCDRDHFSGKLYRAAGFRHVGGTLTMSYVEGKRRVRREKYMKKNLASVFSLSAIDGREIDICAENGVFACWNSGTDKYLLLGE